MSTDYKESIISSLDKLYEFEQEPVSENKLQPGRHFAGLFAGEHVAGTEFVIGAMFVAWGVRAYDIFVGLLIGNALAVLTWTLVCAPIAVGTRLTLYWYLRKIAGPVTTAIYNVLNAILFCILAGCMITVSASAVRIPFNIPAQTNWYPQDIRFVLVVIVVGAAVVTLAILGFKKLAQFASICSPWLLLMFVAGALVTLPAVAANTIGKAEITSWGQFWAIANNAIWVGRVPGGGKPITFWQVAAFAWICNLAMHGGLSDMALLRYARKIPYGLYSAFGMFLGHYLAWIAAGIMGAAAAIVLKTSIGELDSGAVAMQALGLSGIIAVVIAGWTTSNPTLYRAGMAFQAVTTGWPRWLVTLLAGVGTTAVACFPFVFTKLLQFVGYYGLLLMPVGAIVFTEHWIFPKIGFSQYWVSRKNLAVSWPALASWGIAIALALFLEQTGRLHLFYLFVPVWFLTTVLYIIFSWLAGAAEQLPVTAAATVSAGSDPPQIRQQTDRTDDMVKENFKQSDPALMISKIIAIAMLGICLGAAVWVYVPGAEGYEQRLAGFKSMLIWPSVIYFVSGTIWAVRRDKTA